jgi:hypothetical protein
MAGPQAAKLPIPHNRSFRPQSALRKPARKPGRERAHKPRRGATRSGYGYRTIWLHFVNPKVTQTAPSRPGRPQPAATPPAARYG